MTVKLHPDYAKKKAAVDRPPEDTIEANDDSEDAEPGPQAGNREGNIDKLPKGGATEILRLQHALLYAIIQGRAFRQKGTPTS